MTDFMGRFEFNPGASTASIEARSSVGPVLWHATGLVGWLQAEVVGNELVSGADASGHLEMEIGELKSGNPLYDSELLRRVHARRHPVIEGDLRFLAPADGGGVYRLAGDLTFHGVTREVEGTVNASIVGEGRLVITGKQEFDIRDYDLTPPRVLGMQIHPQFTVEVHLEAVVTEGR